MKDEQLKTLKSTLVPLIQAENERQLEKWGVQKHDPLVWVAFTAEELGELSSAIAEHKWRDGPVSNVVKEAIQTATLCLKIAESYALKLKDG